MVANQSQSILVSHFVEFSKEENDDGKSDSPDKQAEDVAAWPAHHDRFCREQEDLLSLEIASGCSSAPARLLEQGNVPILLPGSLRQRGEFCLLDLSLKRGEDRRFAWRVQDVDIRRVQRYP